MEPQSPMAFDLAHVCLVRQIPVELLTHQKKKAGTGPPVELKSTDGQGFKQAGGRGEQLCILGLRFLLPSIYVSK